MTRANEAFEIGLGVLRFIDKSIVLAFLLASAYGVAVSFRLIEARHQLEKFRRCQLIADCRRLP